MRKLQQFRVTVQGGKEIKKEPIGDIKKVVDSCAEALELDNSITTNREVEISKEKKSIRIFNVWEDKGELKKPAKKVVKKPVKEEEPK